MGVEADVPNPGTASPVASRLKPDEERGGRKQKSVTLGTLGGDLCSAPREVAVGHWDDPSRVASPSWHLLSDTS